MIVGGADCLSRGPAPLVPPGPALVDGFLVACWVQAGVPIPPWNPPVVVPLDGVPVATFTEDEWREGRIKDPLTGCVDINAPVCLKWVNLQPQATPPATDPTKTFLYSDLTGRLFVGPPTGGLVPVGTLTTEVANGLYDSIGSATSAILAHVAQPDPHPQYLTQAEADSRYAPVGAAGGDWSAHRQAGTSPLETWHPAGCYLNSVPQAGAVLADTLIALPFLATRNVTVQRLAVGLPAVVAGNDLRLGIYASAAGGNLYPTSLVADSGNIPAVGSAPLVATVSATLTAGTLYWLVANYSGPGDLTVFGVERGDCWAPVGWQPTLDAPRVGWRVAMAYGALPATFPAGAVGYGPNDVPLLFCRLAG